MTKFEMDNNKILVSIVGATASGKTAIAIKLAQYFNTEIISADSRQFYRELEIGTAKPSKDELQQAIHHFINNKSIVETYSAGDFEKEALMKLDELFLKHDIVILTGGSGMYIDALCTGFDQLPKVDTYIRELIISRYEKEGIGFLQNEIKKNDPDYFYKVDSNNPQRLMRALEVIEATGKTFTSYLLQQNSARKFKVVTLGLKWDRNDLYERINSRVDMMIAQGLEKEVRSNLEYRNQYALKTVGYSEFFDYIDGKQDMQSTVNLIKQHTRNFAKRQLTWFRRNADTIWVDALNEKAIFDTLKSTFE